MDRNRGFGKTGRAARSLVTLVILLLIWAAAAPTVMAQDVSKAAKTAADEVRDGVQDLESTMREILPQTFTRVRFLDVKLWQWTGLVLLVFVAYAASWIVTWLLYRVAKVLVSRTRTDLDDRFLAVAVRPLRLAIAVAFFALGSLVLELGGTVQGILIGLEKGLAILAVAWFALSLTDLFSDVVRQRFEDRGEKAALSVIPLGRKAVKVVFLGLAVIAVLQNLGFNVTGILAGLGVGGLAVALAAQKTIENLFGGVTLIADQPVRVGDFCRFGDNVGTVEDVGLRSTRIRTLDRTIISVPNAQFSQIQLENFAKRDRIRLYTTLGLRYETTPEQLRHVLAGLRKLLVAHPKVHLDPARVRFVGFGAYSLDLEVFAYVLTSDWNEFLKIREDIYLRMMDVVSASGTGFAFPSQTTYLARDEGLDDERGSKAESEVRVWRDKGELPFPDFAPETISQLDGTLDYPPEGSATKVPAS